MLNPPPVREGLFVGDRVITIGYISKVHGIGKIVNVRTVKDINLYAVIFPSSHTNEFTELQLRRVSI